MENPIKFEELIDVNDEFVRLTAQVVQLNDALKDIKTSASGLKESLGGLSGANGASGIGRAAGEADKLAEAQKKLEDTLRKTEKAIAALNKQKSLNTKEAKLQKTITDSEVGSYNQLYAQWSLNAIKLKEMSSAMRENTVAGKELEAETARLYAEMTRLQGNMGPRTLQVGNYKKAWDGLGNSASQLTRELPSLAMSANMFFLAISNNIPIMADEINRLKIRNAELNAEGIKTPAVWKTVLRSFMSFNTVMMVGVALLTVYGGKIVTWIGQLFEANDKLVKLKDILDGVNKKMKEGVGTYTTNLVLLKQMSHEWLSIGNDLDKQNEFIERNKENWGKLGVTVTDVNDAYNVLVYNTDDVVKSMQQRAMAIAGASLAEEEYKKQIIARQDFENKLQNGLSFWDKASLRYKALNEQYKDVFIEGKWHESDFDAYNKQWDKWFDNTKSNIEKIGKKGDKIIDITNKMIDKSKSILKNVGIDPYVDTSKQEAYHKKMVDLQKDASDAIVGSIKDEHTREVEEIVNKYEDKKKELKKDSEFYKKNKKEVDKIIIDLEKAKYVEIAKYEEKYNKEQRTKKEQKIREEQTYQNKVKKIISDAEEDIAATTYDKYQLKRDKLVAQHDEEIRIANDRLIKYWDEPEVVEKVTAQIKALWEKLENDIKKTYEQEAKDRDTKLKKEAEDKLKSFDIQAEYEKQIFDLAENTNKEKELYEIEAERKRIKKILEINKDGDLKLSDQKIDVYKKTLDKLDKEYNKAEKKFEKKDIYEIMGIKLKDEEKDVLNQSISYATGAIKDLANSYIESAQAAVRASQDRVSSAEKALDREKEAKANGYAYNTELAEKELAAAKKQQDKALKQEEKAKKASILIDSALQASSLITATANLWKAFSPLGLIGIALAVSSTALMWGSFAAAKAKALSVTKSSSASKNYGEGGIEFLEGGSHSSGNDIPIGTTKDGRRRNAEGGEAMIIINKKRTAKYKHQLPDIVNALNKGIFEQKYMSAFSGNVNVNSSVDLSNVEKGINTLTKQGERRVYTDSKGRIVEQYKNLRRVIA